MPGQNTSFLTFVVVTDVVDRRLRGLGIFGADFRLSHDNKADTRCIAYVWLCPGFYMAGFMRKKVEALEPGYRATSRYLYGSVLRRRVALIVVPGWKMVKEGKDWNCQ